MGYSCEQLKAANIDVTGCGCESSDPCEKGCAALIAEGSTDAKTCGCEDTCTQVCTQYLEQGYSCQQCEMAGLQCSACDECGPCACKTYLDMGYSCQQLEAAGLDCSGCDC